MALWATALEGEVPRTPVSTLNETYPSDCAFLSLVRAEYADWNWYTAHGYIRYSRSASEWTHEHQLVARLAYGLPNGSHVHHIDENRTNNRADNLSVLSPAEHARLHFAEYRERAVVARHGYLPEHFGESCKVVCAHCGKTFTRKASHVKRVDSHFCSRACACIASRKADIPDPDTLFGLMVEVSNWCELGRMFGVSDNAVRKWAKRYGLDLSVCNGWKQHA